MTSDTGDTLWLRTYEVDANRVRLVRYQRLAGGVDSVSATIDARTLAPIASHHHRQTPAGPLTAEILYGAGFEGQARLTLASPTGELSENLRTPPPFLDAGQIPHSLAGLELGSPDTLTFNYVAPFDRQALNAQLILGRLDTFHTLQGPIGAYPVRLRVSGLEERYWISADADGHRLLRWRDVTRGITWTRVASVAP